MRVTRSLLRLLQFDLRGLASLGLWCRGRPHGVPAGAVPVGYAGGQNGMLTVVLGLATAELAAVELFLLGVGAPGMLRLGLLALDAYAVLLGLTLIAGGVTRPHVVTDDAVRLRYGAFVDVTFERRLVTGARTQHRQERRPVVVEGGTLAVGVLGRTNVVVELAEPVTATRPLGEVVRVRTFRFFADDPAAAVRLLTADRSLTPRT